VGLNEMCVDIYKVTRYGLQPGTIFVTDSQMERSSGYDSKITGFNIQILH